MTARKVLPDALAEPKPTVREAMRFGAFASAKLVAGAEGLDRSIEWVRSMETPEVQPRAGDLMFTTGFPIKDDREAQIRRSAAQNSDAGGVDVGGEHVVCRYPVRSHQLVWIRPASHRPSRRCSRRAAVWRPSS